MQQAVRQSQFSVTICFLTQRKRDDQQQTMFLSQVQNEANLISTGPRPLPSSKISISEVFSSPPEAQREGDIQKLQHP